MTASERKTFFGSDVAEHQQNGVRWRIVGAEKLLHVVESGGVQIGKIAVEIVRVGPVAKGYRRHIQPGKTAIGLVQHVDANFFFHHVALIAQILVVHFQGAHAVGFEPQHAFEGVGGHGFVVVGDVVVRRAIQNAAG